LIHLGHHSGYTCMGQLSGLGLAPDPEILVALSDHGINPLVVEGRTHASRDENLAIRFGKETAQVFKKITKEKR